MRNQIAILCLLAPIGCTSGYDYSQWSLYAPEEAGFEVRFPSEPTEGVNNETDLTMYSAGVERSSIDDLGYSCVWHHLEQPLSHPAEEWGYLEAFQEEAESRGTLLSAKEIFPDGKMGREFVFSQSPDNVVRCRVLLSGVRFVQLIVLGKDEQAVRAPEAEAFFSSFKFK